MARVHDQMNNPSGCALFSNRIRSIARLASPMSGVPESKRLIWVVIAMLASSLPAGTQAQTVIVNTRAEVSFMASLWETDSIEISGLANAQYPLIGGGTNLWRYIDPENGINRDGDTDIEMAIDSSGTGANGNNDGYSPIHCEIIHSSSAIVDYLQTLNHAQAKTRGIFRMYTE